MYLWTGTVVKAMLGMDARNGRPPQKQTPEAKYAFGVNYNRYAHHNQIRMRILKNLSGIGFCIPQNS